MRDSREFPTTVKDALLQMLAAQSESLVAHLERGAELATNTALKLGLSPSEVALTRLGAELHDVGKIGIPTAILDKPGALDAEEEWFVQRHSEIGERLLAASVDMQAVAPIVRAIHERPDGRGYPDGLRLEEIPVSSRIIAVVDAYLSMITDRPYQPAVSIEAALVELRRHSGTQFDPAVVDVFEAVLADTDATKRAA